MRVAVALLLVCSSAVASERSIIADKSEIGFSVKQMGVSVSGGFKRFAAKIDLDPKRPDAGAAQIAVDIASISTGTDEGDETALDKAWLDAAGFPQATFKSTSVRAIAGERYEAKGTLTIKGTPREITVPFTLDNQSDGDAVVAGEFQIRRTDFGVGAGKWNEGDLVANEVPIHFRLTLAKEHP